MADLFALEKPFQHTCSTKLTATTRCYWFVFQGHDIYLQLQDDHRTVPLGGQPPVAAEDISYSRCIGIYDSIPCMAVASKHSLETIHGLLPCTLREAHLYIDSDLWTIAGRASQILRWHKDHAFCGRCGEAMIDKNAEEVVNSCPACGYFTYPRLSPAVIMAVTKDDAILLGRSSRFPAGIYSTLAGFVEPGETLEEAVQREVKEETGIDITDINYIASQCWPFPHSLMVGFTARYAGGELKADGVELEDANWFTADNMPGLPTSISIARHLIELFLKKQKKT